ncbi:hypothetical protein MBLNU13_g09099t1 [Cladosporium sp. NU13]
MTRKVSFAVDMTADKAAAERRVEGMGKGKGKVERASQTTNKVERSGMWATIKHYSEPTAHQSLHLVACRADAHILNKHAGAKTWTVALYSKLLSPKHLVELIADSGVRPVKKWLHGFTEAGRSERTEQDWEEAVKRAHASHALHEHMDDLKASRESLDQATSSAVSSALGHRQTVEPKRAVAAPLPSMSSAGSIFSNERIVFPSPVERPATEIITPGLRQLKPTLPRSVDTSELEASSPREIYESHPIFHDSAHVKFAQLRDFDPRDIRSNVGDCFDLRYFPARDRNETFDQFNEITTSYSESLKDYPPMGKSQLSLDLIDRMMQGDGEMALFGRWRHRKDAPLDVVRDMIDRDLRGPGACSLYGPGGLKIEDHPLVCLYNTRVEKLEEEQAGTLQEPEAPQLSPILLQGNNASQRLSMRSATLVTFGMSEDGVFQTTGFQMRSGSVGSTVDSTSPTESSDFVTSVAQEGARRDSGVHGLKLDTSFEKVLDRTGHSSLGNYEVLRYYSPDPALDYKAINNKTAPKYCRKQRPKVTREYINNVIHRGYNRSMQPPPRARLEQQQRPQTRKGQNLAHQGTPQSQAPPQAPQDHNAGQSKFGHDSQWSHSRRHGQQEQPDRTAHQLNNALSTSQSRRQQPPPSAQACQASEVKQQKHVRLDEPKNISQIIPGNIILVAPEDAENAMFSDDDEDTVVDNQEAPNNNAATNTSPGTHHTMPTPRSMLKTDSSYAAASVSSSDASAAAKDLNTSTELTPAHETPGTTASSGCEYQISAPACARSRTRKPDGRLKQIEIHASNKAVSL